MEPNTEKGCFVPATIHFFARRTNHKREEMATNKDTDVARIEAIIDQNLKRVYSDLVQEELPDRFKDLLSALKAQEAEGKMRK